MNHGRCEHRANIIFNAEIVKTCPNCAQYSLCVCAKTDKIWFAPSSCLRQQCGACSQSHSNKRAFSRNMFVARLQAMQHMHGSPVCNGPKLSLCCLETLRGGFGGVSPSHPHILHVSAFPQISLAIQPWKKFKKGKNGEKHKNNKKTCTATESKNSFLIRLYHNHTYP